MLSASHRFLLFSLFLLGCTGALQGASQLPITSGTPPGGTVGESYNFTFTATDGGCSAPPVYSWSASAPTGPGTGLPPGLSLDSESGVLSGTPTTPRPFMFTVTVTVPACSGQTGSAMYTITIGTVPPPTIISGTLPNAAINTPYSFTFQATGGACTSGVNYNWTATGIPAGLSLLDDTGVLSGTPTAPGPATLVVTVVSEGCDSQASQTYNINVTSPSETFYVLNPSFGDSSAISITAINGGTSTNCPAVQTTDPCYPYFSEDSSFADFTTDGQGNFIVPAGSAVLKFTPGNSTPTVVAQNTNPGLADTENSPNFASAVLDSAGNIIVADNANQAIWLFPPDGSNAILVGNYPVDEGFEDVFVRIPPGDAGHYVVVEDESDSRTNFYKFVACQPMPVSCPMSNPPITVIDGFIPGDVEGFTFDASGNYVITVNDDGSNSVDTVNPATGIYQNLLNAGDEVFSFPSFPLGIFYDSQTGNYLVANEQTDPSGIYYLSSGPVGSADAALIYTGPPLVNPTSVLTLPPPSQTIPPPPVIPPLVISGGPLPGGFAFEPYSSSVTASGGVPPYTYTGTGFPTGIGINQFTGAITGTTTKTGTFPLSITVTDSTGTSTSASLSLSIATAPPVKVTGGMLPTQVVQAPVSLALSASGGAPPYTFSLAAGQLPPGLNLQLYGTLSGIPNTVGSYFFTVRATDTAGGSAVGTFQITINPTSLVPTTSSPLPSGMVTITYPGFSFTLNGGDLPYIFTVTGGTFPPGLTLSPDGLITGVPTTAGNYTFTVNQTDSSTDPSTAYSMTIQPFGPDLLLSAGSAAFTLAAPTSTLPLPQTIQVQSSVVTESLGYSVSVSPSTATWLSATANGTTTPGSFSIALTNAALTLSASTTPYTATVIATCTSGPCTGSQHMVPVSLTVTNTPAQLSVLTPKLSFNTLNSSPQATTELLPVANVGGGVIGFASVTCGAPWCTVAGVPGTLGAGMTDALSVTANPAGLSQGYYYTDISFVTSAGTAQVPVTLFIAPNGTITLAPAGAEFNVPQGGQAVGNTSFEVSISGPQTLTFNAAVSPAVPWLTVTQSAPFASGTQPATVNLVFNQSAVAALNAGAYYTTVVITSASSSNSPQSFEVVLNVTPAAQGTTPNPFPGGLLFLTNATATPPPETVSIYTGSPTSVNYQASAATTSGGTWLSVSPTLGMTSAGSVGQGTVTVNPSGMKNGVYTGTVSYQFSATAVRSVNVTLVVSNGTSTPVTTSVPHPDAAASCTPTQIVPTSTSLVSNFAAPAAWPIDVQVNLSDDCGSPLNNGRVVATFSNGDPPLILGLSDAGGDYVTTWAPQHATNQITISALASVPGLPSATLQIAGGVTANNAPLLANNAVMNFFNPVGGAPLAPGTLIQITGQYLAAQTLSNTQIPIPTSLGGTSVIIGGLQAPISSVSPTQIDAQVPFELPAGQPYQVFVNANNALTAPQSFQAGAASPGLSVINTGYVQASHQTGAPITEASPAMPGEYIAVYLVGMGGTTIPVASGDVGPGAPFALTTIPPTVTLNNENAPVIFSGLIPGLVGVYQVNLQVPADAMAGDQIFALSQGGITSNAGVLPVQ